MWSLYCNYSFIRMSDDGRIFGFDLFIVIIKKDNQLLSIQEPNCRVNLLDSATPQCVHYTILFTLDALWHFSIALVANGKSSDLIFARFNFNEIRNNWKWVSGWIKFDFGNLISRKLQTFAVANTYGHIATTCIESVARTTKLFRLYGCRYFSYTHANTIGCLLRITIDVSQKLLSMDRKNKCTASEEKHSEFNTYAHFPYSIFLISFFLLQSLFAQTFFSW